MSKKFAVILSGCGVYDGTEIHEAVLTLLQIDKQGASYQCFAPNIKQAHVINHLTGKEAKEERNVLVESARIARGKVKDLKEFSAKDFDALIMPGGFGGAKNLSDFAFKGADLTVNVEVERALKETNGAGKPIGSLCITPVIMAKVFKGATLTIGSDVGTAQAIEELGATHKQTTHGEIITDEANKIVTSPCYMLDATISQIEEGAKNVVQKILSMI